MYGEIQGDLKGKNPHVFSVTEKKEKEEKRKEMYLGSHFFTESWGMMTLGVFCLCFFQTYC